MSRKYYIATLCLLLTYSVFSQDKKEDDPRSDTWKKEKKYLRYDKSEGYNGPDDWSTSDPSDIKENRYVPPGTVNRRMYGGSGGQGGTIKYRPQQIQRQRQKRYSGFNRGGGKGTLKYDPKVKRPEPVSAPQDVRSPDIDMPTPPSADLPSSSNGFWNILLIILIIALVATILYFLLRNRQPPNKKLVVDVENDWNPEIISKTELELKLEAAMEREDYRECVRIYFTFILKELIRKGWIRWKKEKTNHHYVMEMGRRDGALQFMECVRIYDLVWYGEYEIDREVFEMLQPSLLNYYKSLEPADE